MPPPIVNGNNAPNWHPTELLFDPRRGMSARQRVTCGKLTSAAEGALLSIVSDAQRIGASGKMVFNNQLPSVEYEFPGVPTNLSGILSEVYFDDWQMKNDDLTNTIFANTVLTASLNYNDRQVLQTYLKLGTAISIQDTVTRLNDEVAAGAVAGPGVGEGGSGGNFVVPSDTGLLAQLRKMIDKDQAEFLDPLPVLQHTSACSPGANYNASRAYEMCIYTTAQLLTEVGSGWAYNLPGRLYSQIASFPTRTAPADEAAYFTWGWLKTRANQGTQTNFMVEAHQEYKLNLWPNIYYAAR
jgi:hypothetical protein